MIRLMIRTDRPNGVINAYLGDDEERALIATMNVGFADASPESFNARVEALEVGVAAVVKEASGGALTVQRFDTFRQHELN